MADEATDAGRSVIRSRPIPETWTAAHWERAWLYLESATAAIKSTTAAPVRGPAAQSPLALWTDVQRALTRSSLKAEPTRMTGHAFHQLLRATYRLLQEEPFMFAAVVTRDVDGWPPAAWTLENEPRHLHPRTSGLDSALLSDLGQGQSWVTGAAVLFLFGIDWEYAADMDSDLAYAHALVTCGRLGHGLLLEGQPLGLQGRMTPALKESAAAELLQLDPSRDCLYLISLSAGVG